MFGASLLTLATLLAAPLAPQDATAAEPAAASDEVASFLADVSARCYDPRADGLKTLSFKLPIKDPMLGHTADVVVSWTDGQEPEMAVTVLDFEVPEQLAMMGATKEMLAPQIEPQAMNNASQFLGQLLGEALKQLSDDAGAGSMGGVEDGNVVIKLAGSGEADDPALEHRLHVDDESTLVKHEIDIQSQMGKQTLVNTFQWAPSKDGEHVVQTGQSVKISMPMMGEMDVQTTTFRHQRVGQMLLLVEQTTEMTNPMMGGGGAVTATLSDLTVNGQAVEVSGAAGGRDADAGHDEDGHDHADHDG